MMVPFSNSSIRTKLSIAFGTALALIVAVGFFGLVQLRTLDTVAHEFRDVWLPRLENLGDIKRAATEHRMLATRRIQTTNFHHLAAIIRGTDAATKALGTAEGIYLRSQISAQERRAFLEFRSHWNDYVETLGRVYQRLEGGELSSAFQEFNIVSVTAFDRAMERLDDLIGLSKVQSAAASIRAQEAYELALYLTIGALIVASVLAVLAIAWISRYVTSPILRVSEAMQRLVGGDYSSAVTDIATRKDEIGVLAGAVGGYRESLVRSRNLAEIAELERERLQAAVTNMSIGLCMFDAKRTLVICNSRFAEIYNLPSELTKPGTSIVDILRARAASGGIGGSDPEAYIQRVLGNIAARKVASSQVELNNGRAISVIHQPMENGGWVATHEDITDRRKAEARIRHMARHDALTDLPNRILFKEQVEDAFRRVPRGEHLALLCIDLDNFKYVNDTLGHPIGDLLLESVAERLRGSLREQDTVARFGGDEFAIIQVGVEQPAGATTLAQRVIDALSAPFDLAGHQIVIGASIGIAIAPMDGIDADQLLKNGDMALYRAKAEGRGTSRFFELEMDMRMQARRALELDMRKAFMHGEFELYYQPVINVRTNEITTCEALLRWHHPARGMVPPSEFIPLAEDIGLIVPIGEWVLRTACSDAMSWPSDIRVAVNLSPVQFKSKRLLESVITALSVSKLSPDRLELEITEGVLLVEHETTLAVLHQLRAYGVRIAMDDFGTGYSSLSYLRSFPFDKIKIDRSFIRNISSDQSSLAIIRAVTGLSASLGMSTTAEGVETSDQLERIRAEGCDEVQGFLFSKAKPANEIRMMFAAVHEREAAVA